MNLHGCSHEAEVREALAMGRWPQAISEELRAHVGACRGCRELILLTTAFRQAHNASVAAAHLPSPGLVWWRAQLRRRDQAVERLTRPLLSAVVFALALMALAGLGGLGLLLRQVPPEELKTALAGLGTQLLSTVSWTGSNWMLPLALLFALVAFGSAVVYFSTDRG